MKTLLQDNQSDKALIVGSVQVLHDIKGQGIDTIRNSVQSLSTSLSTFATKQDEYWKDMADDAVITASEKKSLKNQWNEIVQTEAAIIDVAKEKSVETASQIVTMTEKFDALKTYLNDTLKVFDDMTESTSIPNVSTFNTKFNEYYTAQAKAQAVLTGKVTATLRIIEDLTETGTDGEVVICQGQLYQWVDGDWQMLNELPGGYMGIFEKNSVPDAVEGNYFMPRETWTDQECELMTSKGPLLLYTGDKLYVQNTFIKGKIYVCNDWGWKLITDKNNWRYQLAVNDLIELGEDIPPALQGKITSDIEDAVAEVEEELSPEIAESYTGSYKGTYISDAAVMAAKTIRYKDWYMYTGETVSGTDLVQNTIRRYVKNASGEYMWTTLSQTDQSNYTEYMAALNDVLARQKAKSDGSLDDGFFSTVFCNALCTNAAFIKRLASEIIELQIYTDSEGKEHAGILQSSNYNNDSTKGTVQGFKIDTDGNADFRGTNKIGGEVTLDDDIDIKGDAVVHGAISSSDFTDSTTKLGWRLPTRNDPVNDFYVKMFALQTNAIYAWGTNEQRNKLQTILDMKNIRLFNSFSSGIWKQIKNTYENEALVNIFINTFSEYNAIEGWLETTGLIIFYKASQTQTYLSLHLRKSRWTGLTDEGSMQFIFYDIYGNEYLLTIKSGDKTITISGTDLKEGVEIYKAYIHLQFWH